MNIKQNIECHMWSLIETYDLLSSLLAFLDEIYALNSLLESFHGIHTNKGWLNFCKYGSFFSWDVLISMNFSFNHAVDPLLDSIQFFREFVIKIIDEGEIFFVSTDLSISLWNFS